MIWLDIIAIFLGWLTGAYFGGLYFDRRAKKETDGQDAD